MRIRVFLSFEHSHKSQAIWLGAQLRELGHYVVTEDDFGATSPRSEMTQAVREADIVVALITYAYTKSLAPQRELDLAEAHGKPVVAVFAGLPSRSADASPYLVYRRVELSEDWADSQLQWEQIRDLVHRALATELQRRDMHTVFDENTAMTVERAVLLHDIEDRMLARQITRTRPGWQLSDSQENGLTRVLLWTQASAETHSIVRRRFTSLVPGVASFVLMDSEAPKPPPGVLAIPLAQLSIEDPPPVVSATGKAARPHVERLLRLASEQNQNIPIDVFAERLCGSDKVADLTEQACELAARELHEGDELRLRAICEHALALRFYGYWRKVVDLIDTELRATPIDLASEAEVQRLRLRLEKTNLEYELGNHRALGIEREIRELQLRFGSLGHLHGYVQAGRVRGNILREQGSFDLAERTLQRTIGVAEYLAEHSQEGEPRTLLLADCHRELVGLYIARRDLDRAQRSLEEVREMLPSSPNAMSPAARYLMAALDFVNATLGQRDGVLVKAATPTEQATAALETLSGFGNPIRVAGVYDWLGRAWARQVPKQREDLIRGEEYLRKALRIRQAHGHRYTCGLSHRSLGELYQALRDLDKSIVHYEESRRIFNQQGVLPALATAHGALARAYFGKYSHGDETAKERYREHLEQAEQRYHDIGLATEGLELRYELEHGGRRPFNTVSDDTPLIAVGEYHLHRWIRDYVSSHRLELEQPFSLQVGIGDDAAVVEIDNARPGTGLVFTTDSAPGSLSHLDKSPEYVGRFAVIQTLADILAMGAQPVGLLVNIFLSRAATAGYVRRLVEAVVQEALRYGVAVFGGDVKERNEQSVGCVGIGRIINGAALTRSAARPGHVVGITLASDPSGRGTRQIGARWAQELVEHYKIGNRETARNFPKLAKVVDPRLKYDLLYVPTKVMASAVRSGLMRAAIDTSDGVLACLEILGRESNVGFELDEAAISPLIDEHACSLAEVFELPACLFLFSAGHDWEIVFTCEEEDFAELAAAVDRSRAGNGRVARIGRVVERNKESSMGVLLHRADGSASVVPYYTDEKFVPRHYQDRPSQWLSFASRLRLAQEL